MERRIPNIDFLCALLALSTRKCPKAFLEFFSYLHLPSYICSKDHHRKARIT